MKRKWLIGGISVFAIVCAFGACKEIDIDDGVSTGTIVDTAGTSSCGLASAGCTNDGGVVRCAADACGTDAAVPACLGDVVGVQPTVSVEIPVSGNPGDPLVCEMFSQGLTDACIFDPQDEHCEGGQPIPLGQELTLFEGAKIVAFDASGDNDTTCSALGLRCPPCRDGCTASIVDDGYYGPSVICRVPNNAPCPSGCILFGAACRFPDGAFCTIGCE